MNTSRADRPRKTAAKAVRAHSTEKTSRAKSASHTTGTKPTAAQRAYSRRSVRSRSGDPRPSKLPKRRQTGLAARIPFVATLIAMVGGGIVATLLLTTGAAEGSYRLGDARAANRQLENERATLQREVAAADSAPDLARRARLIGMIPAKDPARLVVASNGAVVVVGKPTPAQGAPVPLLNNESSQQAAEQLQSVPDTDPSVESSGTPQVSPRLPADTDVRAEGEQVTPAQIPTTDAGRSANRASTSAAREPVGGDR